MRDERDSGSGAFGFMPQLDGLRAFAVAGVLVNHFLYPFLFTRVPLLAAGLLGVRLFFVLSGFLITGILIQARGAIDTESARPRDVLRLFYIRRTLRIFPLYYLALLLVLVFGSAGLREQLPWLATYTYNFWLAAHGSFPDHVNHFWSLCVEEQFYLLWPWTVLFAPRKRLTTIAIATIASAWCYRTVAYLLEFNAAASYVLTPSSLDALGMGALLAIVTRGGRATATLEMQLRRSALPIGAAGIAIGATAAPSGLTAVFGETMVALVCAWLVAGASRGFAGIGGALLEARPIVYLGKISYGIYVYHLLVPPVAGPLLAALAIHPMPRSVDEFVIYSLMTVAIASLSWWCFEGPINGFRKRLGKPQIAVSRPLVG